MHIRTSKGKALIKESHKSYFKVVYLNDSHEEVVPRKKCTPLLTHKELIYDLERYLKNFKKRSIKYLIRTSKNILASATNHKAATEKLKRLQVDACWRFRDNMPNIYMEKL